MECEILKPIVVDNDNDRGLFVHFLKTITQYLMNIELINK